MAKINVLIPRQSPRHKGILPITLVVKAQCEHITVPAATKDFSSVGLRIQSRVFLIAGQRIDVLFASHPSDPKACQVMWTKPARSLLPGEAGLKFLDEG